MGPQAERMKSFYSLWIEKNKQQDDPRYCYWWNLPEWKRGSSLDRGMIDAAD